MQKVNEIKNGQEKERQSLKVDRRATRKKKKWNERDRRVPETRNERTKTKIFSFLFCLSSQNARHSRRRGLQAVDLQRNRRKTKRRRAKENKEKKAKPPLLSES